MPWDRSKDLHWPVINPPRPLWIEGSSNPHRAESHHEPSHIGPLIKLCQRRGKVACLTDTQLISQWLGNHWKEACGFPNGHLIEQTRGRCPHILALANTRIALRAWREDPGDITRILLTIVNDSLARQDAKMGDTITLCTRILLATRDLHSKRIDHGGSSESGALEEVGRRETWLNCWVALTRVG